MIPIISGGETCRQAGTPKACGDSRFQEIFYFHENGNFII
tara:strand:- start:80 stop:199 length:120 start_codon:yes stop_codon:yes gene_type:complete